MHRLNKSMFLKDTKEPSFNSKSSTLNSKCLCIAPRAQMANHVSIMLNAASSQVFLSSVRADFTLKATACALTVAGYSILLSM